MVKLLNCTIRDGGYINNWEFTKEQVLDCYKSVTEGNIDYFEIGFRREKNKKEVGKFGQWYNASEELINETIQDYQGCKIAIMAQLGTFEITDFVPKKIPKFLLLGY